MVEIDDVESSCFHFISYTWVSWKHLGEKPFHIILTFKVQGIDFFFINTSEVLTHAIFMVPPVAIPASYSCIWLILFIVTSASRTRIFIFNFFIIDIVIIRHTVIWIFVRAGEQVCVFFCLLLAFSFCSFCFLSWFPFRSLFSRSFCYFSFCFFFL